MHDPENEYGKAIQKTALEGWKLSRRDYHDFFIMKTNQNRRK